MWHSTKMNYRTSLLQSFFSFNCLPTRNYGNKFKGIKYPGFTYYPRSQNFKDPPYEPSKLFLVTRYKKIKGTNHKEKQALQLLNIDGKKGQNQHINVVKNIPTINALLWKVKHLVQIKPITWKGELPKDGDFSGTYLRRTGELVISPRLKLTPDELEATENYVNNCKALNRKYFKEYLQKKWMQAFTGDV